MNLPTTSECVLLFILVFSISVQTMVDSSEVTRSDLFPKRQFERVAAPPNKTRFTQEEKDLILEIHNAYRSLVFPTTTNMKELIWDDDLEEFSHHHSLACTGAHSHRNMVKKFIEVDPSSWQSWNLMGENLYYSYAPDYSIEEALYMFWDEGEKYDIYTHNCRHEQTCGHYRVLVSADSDRVGCAINTCETFNSSKFPTPAVLLVCEYNAMFLTASRPYDAGEPCSRCEKYGRVADHCRHRLCTYKPINRQHHHVANYYEDAKYYDDANNGQQGPLVMDRSF